jgi:hypothetical protein
MEEIERQSDLLCAQLLENYKLLLKSCQIQDYSVQRHEEVVILSATQNIVSDNVLHFCRFIADYYFQIHACERMLMIIQSLRCQILLESTEAKREKEDYCADLSRTLDNIS